MSLERTLLNVKFHMGDPAGVMGIAFRELGHVDERRHLAMFDSGVPDSSSSANGQLSSNVASSLSAIEMTGGVFTIQ